MFCFVFCSRMRRFQGVKPAFLILFSSSGGARSSLKKESKWRHRGGYRQMYYFWHYWKNEEVGITWPPLRQFLLKVSRWIYQRRTFGAGGSQPSHQEGTYEGGSGDSVRSEPVYMDYKASVLASEQRRTQYQGLVHISSWIKGWGWQYSAFLLSWCSGFNLDSNILHLCFLLKLE